MITKKSIYVVVSIVSVILFTNACNNSNQNIHSHGTSSSHNDHAGHDHGNEDAHDHGYAKQEITQIQGSYELFMEMSPLIKGDTYTSLIHITRLNDYKPITAKSITITLKGSETVKYKAPKINTGIYKASFTPKQSGKYTYIVSFADKGISRNITLDNMIIYNHDDYTDKEHEEEANLINYLKEQAWETDFALTQLKKEAFSRVIKTSGKILPAPGDETIITALHAGTISLTNKLIEGKKVAKGEILSNISSDLIHQNLTNDYLQAKNQFEKAKLDYKRAKKLIAEKLISEKEYLVTRLDFESTKNTFNNIAKYYSNGNENVHAPNNGFIRSVFVQEGQFIEEGQPIATIIKNSRIVLKADIPQQYNHLASGFYTANFSPVYSDKTYKIKDLHGKRTSFSSALPENSLFTSVHFEFDADDEIMPGSYAEVYLKSASVQKVLTIPVTSLLEDQGNYFVFVMVGGENYRKTYIKTGDTDGEFIEVLAGLNEGDYVVSKGTYQVHLASLGNAAPTHSHSH